MALVAGGCAGSSPVAGPSDRAAPNPATSPAHEAGEPPAGLEVELVAKRAGAPTEPAHAWVGWAHTERGLQALWASFRLDGEPLGLDGQAVVLAATGESSSCPSRLADAVVEGDTLRLSVASGPAVSPPPDDYACTADLNPVTFVLRADRDVVEGVRAVDFGDTEVSLGAAGQVTYEDDAG